MRFLPSRQFACMCPVFGRMRRSTRSGFAWNSAEKAFSLVEITIALGILSFSLVSILSLVPVGLNTLRESMDATAQTHIVQSLINEAYLSDRGAMATSTRYYDESGRSIDSQADIDAGKWLYKAQVAFSDLTVTDGAKSTSIDRGQTFLVAIEARNRPASRPWSLSYQGGGLPPELLVNSAVLLK